MVARVNDDTVELADVIQEIGDEVDARIAAGPPDLRRDADICRKAADAMKQASDPTRVRILAILAEGRFNVTDLATELGGLKQPTVSHHMAQLRHTGMVVMQREGVSAVYKITERGRLLVVAAQSLAG
jgi:DNA-binding transcriptional ArsR family regulator